MSGEKLYRYMFNHRFTFVFSNIKKKSWNSLSGCILFYFYLYQKFEVIHIIIIMVKIVTVLMSLMALIRAWLFFLKFRFETQYLRFNISVTNPFLCIKYRNIQWDYFRYPILYPSRFCRYSSKSRLFKCLFQRFSSKIGILSFT